MNEDRPAQPHQQALAAPLIPDERLGEPLYGVRGWLLLFCITTTILRPLMLIVSASKSTTSVDAVINIALSVFTFCVGVSLWKVSQRALGLLKTYFIIYFALGFLSLFATIVELGRTGRSLAEPRLGDSFGASAKMLVFAIIWWSYFRKSDRVRFTFGRNI